MAAAGEPSAAERLAECADALEIVCEHAGLLGLARIACVSRGWHSLALTLRSRWASVRPAGRLGCFGSGPAELDDPECAVRLPDGGLAVTDTCNHRLQFFSAECATSGGAPSRHIGRRGSAPGEFNGPMGLATDGTHLFVVDCDNARVQQLRISDGTCVDCVGALGSGPGQLTRPSGLALSSSVPSRLFVADTYNHRISVFGVSPLRFLYCIGQEGARTRRTLRAT